MNYNSLKKAWSNYCFRAGKQAMDPITVADIYAFLDYQDRQQNILKDRRQDVVAVTFKAGEYSTISKVLQEHGIFMKTGGNWTRLKPDEAIGRTADVFFEVNFDTKTADIFKSNDRKMVQKPYKVIYTAQDFVDALRRSDEDA